MKLSIRILAILLIVLVLLSLCACGKFTCDLCGQEKTVRKHNEKILGQKVVICSDCYKELKELAKEIKG